jgi:hypothetical protein
LTKLGEEKVKAKARVVKMYARMWPREVFDHYPTGSKTVMAKGLNILNQPGVYVLYRDDRPYYVGQANKLRHRLWQHACKPGTRYYNFWNFFAAFVVPSKASRNEIEGILIAAMPTANSAKPKMKREALPKEVVKMMRLTRRSRVFFQSEDV